MTVEPFVPDDFTVPRTLSTPELDLEPLGPEHNAADYAAWQSSIDHVQSTPGFEGRRWPDERMTLDDNRADLEMHAEHFRERVGFTYTVRDPQDGDVIGCVYIYPDGEGPQGRARVRSWVRRSHDHLDETLYRAVSAWLERDWPFTSVDYTGRP